VLWAARADRGACSGGFVLIARTEQLEARHLEDGARARYAAEAGCRARCTS
jgi:hypothetical protein